MSNPCGRSLGGQQQKERAVGTLYVVATPIGNLEDITLRALRVLREVSLIAAEDTRTARKLLSRYDIHTPLSSYWEHNELARVEPLLAALEEGDVAIISEAGTPGISDPGLPIVRAAAEAGFSVVPIPGPTAVATAVAIAALPVERFLYLGFLPRTRKARRELLAEVGSLPFTLVCFESPHRVVDALVDMADLLGPRQVALCRELTKRHEEVWRGALPEALAHLEAHSPRGEFTLVVDRPSDERPRWEKDRVLQAVLHLVAEGRPRKEALREVAAQSGWPRREVYDLWTRRPSP
ncbi:MAG: 16S rRNA (cytidine(1402)-2'-O)-methyltransferase [Chloroflexi bacterium]|nr:16S rRNA (cytidine(1402)-2'-O)-methyltransferase [Chloroflexota bacterium]